ncbi:MAG: rRNA pseudouridine synthase [Deltaproteobacteria bacterium]|nr:rRNA pseudouridine synthase [Deltaproteobacteria bacterium]
MRLDRLLSNRGYCSRSEVKDLIRHGYVLVNGEKPKGADANVDPATVTFEGEALDPGEGLILMLHKPAGYTCSHKELGEVIYDLLPERYSRRNPPLSSVGRLDKDTTGLLLVTDDGALLHKLTSPKYKVAKLYEVELESDLRGDEKALFASGTLVLEDEEDALEPAELSILDSRHVTLSITEGRYHQVKRMFEAVGNKVLRLHRSKIGELTLEGLPEGEFRELTESEVQLALKAQD